MTDIYMRILLSAQQGNTLSVVKSVTNAIGGSAGGGGGLGGALLGLGGLAATAAVAVTGAAIAMGAASVKTAADFQQTMNQTRALAGLTDKEAKSATDSILRMATEVGQTPQQLAEGLYYVKSAGFDAAASLNILNLSAKAAQTGNIDTQVTANALTASLKAMGAGADQAKQYMDIMTVAVSTGKTEWKDFAPVIGRVSLEAKQAGVKFTEANAALSVLTNTFPSTRQAADGLRALLQTTGEQSFGQLEKRADALGIAFDKNAYASMNFGDRLKYLQTITGGNTEKLRGLLGRQNAVAAATALLTGNSKDYTAALNDMNNAQGAADKAFEKTQQGFNQQMSRLNATWEVMKVKVGNVLLPIITDLLKNITPIVAGFGDWITKSHVLENAMGFVRDVASDLRPIFEDIARQIQPLVKGFQDWAEKSHIVENAGLVLRAIIKGIGEGIRAATPYVVAITKELAKFAGEIKERVEPIVRAIAQFIKDHWGEIKTIAEGVWNYIVGVVQIAWSIIKGVIKIALDIIGGDWKKAWEDLKEMASGVWEGIKRAIGGLGQVIWTLLQAAWRKIQDDARRGWNSFVGTIQNIVNGVKQWLSDRWQEAVNTVVGWFKWLYNHNYYFKNLVDSIAHWITYIKEWLSQRWAEIVFTAQSKWKQVSDSVSNTWKTVSSFISNAWKNYVQKPLTDLWNNITRPFTSAGSQANSWGKNLIQGFIDGAKSMFGSLGQMAQDAANQVADKLGFHSPAKSGPGADLMSWGPGLIRGFSQSVEQALPILDATMNITARHVAAPFVSPAPVTSAAGPSRPTAGGGVTIVHHHHYNINTMARSQSEVKRLVDMIEKEQGHRVRVQTPGYSSGGIF